MASESLSPHVQHHICKVPCFNPAGRCLQGSRSGTKPCQVGRQACLWRQGARLQHEPAAGGGWVTVTSTGHMGHVRALRLPSQTTCLEDRGR